MHELLIQVVFYLFAGLAVVSGLMVITQNNPVRCVLFLVVTFFASSVLWIITESEFLALILVLVYVGAVMTLFLFVIMMLDIETESIKSHLIRYLPFGLIIVALLTSLMMVAVPKDTFKKHVQHQSNNVRSVATKYVMDTADEIQVIQPDQLSNTEALGMVLYTDYVLPFELAALILLVAIISAITLAHRTVTRSKRQDILKQLMVKKSDRVKLIDLKTEK